MKKSYFLIYLIFFALTCNFLLDAAVITSLTPSVGPSSGGTIITIVGNGFTGTTSVNFNDKPASSFIVNSDQIITAVTPPHTPQVVTVTVEAPSGISPPSIHSFFTFQGNWNVLVNTLNDNILIIDTVSDTIVFSPVDGSGVGSIAITSDGTKAYITNLGNNNVPVIDIATGTVMATPTVGVFPIAGTTLPNATKAYITNTNSDNVSVIDIASNTVIATIPVGDGPIALAPTPDSTRVYVANSIGNSVSVIDTLTNTVIATLPVGIQPFTIAITPDGTKAYVINADSNTASVIDTSTNTIIATIPVEDRPLSLAINPDGTRVYVANFNNDNVSVIDTISNTVIATIGVGNGPIHVIVNGNGTVIYVSNLLSNTFSVIDALTNTVTATIPVLNAPVAASVTPDGKKVYLINEGANSVSVIDAVTNTVIKTLVVGFAPQDISVTPDQAPLAKFIFSLGLAGSFSFFDASDSVSPTGTIANYFWDFGDGTTLSTSSPTVSHFYAVAGSYSVSLTVTNSAGTSTTQIFTPLFSLLGGELNSYTVLKNGGPTAILTQEVTILPTPIPIPLPPTDLRVRQVRNIFATQTDFINILSWKAPNDGSTPIKYEIFRNKKLTKLIATIHANERLRFEDHDRRKRRKYTYFIVTVDEFGNRSPPAVVVLKG